MAMLLYLHRVCLSTAAPAIRATFGLGVVEMGWVFNAFFLAYALAQVPAGWLGDRLGVRGALTGAALTWSLCTALTGWAGGPAGLFLARFAVGLGQAGAYPMAARVNSRWIPFQRRALASGLINLGGRAGGALTPWLTATLILAWGDWRPVFWLYGLSGLLWALFFGFWFRERPSQHPGCNPAEVDLVEKSQPPEAADPYRRPQGIPWRAILRSRSLWLQCLMQFVSNVGWAFLITWLPTVLIEEYHMDLAGSGLLSSLPLLGGAVGCLLGGLATDHLTRRLGLRWGRSLIGVVAKLLAAAAVLASLSAAHPVGFATAMVVASFANDLSQGAMWAYFQDTAGAYVATTVGWANMFGNLGAALSPILLGYLATRWGWTGALAVCSGMFFLAGLCWLGIDARTPLGGCKRVAARGKPGFSEPRP
jgi:sugar phosphate permease